MFTIFYYPILYFNTSEQWIIHDFLAYSRIPINPCGYTNKIGSDSINKGLKEPKEHQFRDNLEV